MEYQWEIKTVWVSFSDRQEENESECYGDLALVPFFPDDQPEQVLFKIVHIPTGKVIYNFAAEKQLSKSAVEELAPIFFNMPACPKLPRRINPENPSAFYCGWGALICGEL